MTAAARGPAPGEPLVRGASPATVRCHLMEPERTRFVTAYETAMDEARRTLDLAPVLDLVEHHRAIAIAHSDPEAFRRGVQRWAEVVTGAVPDDEPFEVTRTRAGL